MTEVNLSRLLVTFRLRNIEKYFYLKHELNQC